MKRSAVNIKIKNVVIISLLLIITMIIAIVGIYMVNDLAKKQSIDIIKKAILIIPEDSRHVIDNKVIDKILEGDITKSEMSKVNKILKDYGVDETSFYSTKNGSSYINDIVITIGGSYFVIILVLIVYTYLHIKKYDERIFDMTEYADKVINGNYELCISDNEEGELSILKNRIYDMTVILREKNELLNKDKKELKRLMEDISHQFKTPLTSLGLLNELLYKDMTQDKKKEFLGNMRKELDKLQWLITTLLKLSQFDAKAIELKSDNVSIRGMLEKSIDTFSLISDIKGVNINIINNQDILLKCDMSWTVEAINNIVKNSIEHGASNVKLDYQENPLFTEITIEDDGEGIKKEDLPHIFDRFYKSKDSRSDSVGIGLALVKSITESQNGEIRVESEEGKYTSFKFKFYKIK